MADGTLGGEDMLQSYNRKHLVNTLINKTDSLICVYEQSSGRLVRAFPDERCIPDKIDGVGGKSVCYVVTPKQLEELRTKFPGRPLDDIGVLAGPPSSGRNGAPMVKIYWAKDLKEEVLVVP